MAGKFPPVETLCSHFFVFPGFRSLGACSPSWHNLIRRPQACAPHRSHNRVLWLPLQLSPARGAPAAYWDFPILVLPHILNSAITGEGLLVRARASAVLGTEVSGADDSTQPPWWFCCVCHTWRATDSPLRTLHPLLNRNH